ncbi:hypothetical protein BKA70DRAFT_1309898 [Coprinopsis sp. MPI-PUGE-AT-0042]|nr:hypothetical protein BKA70DRAFT_1309898 [Coprinopsis sp. MPI-PUGE-AT-0042]
MSTGRMTNTGMLYGPLCHCRCRRRSASYLYLVLSGSGLRSSLSSLFFLRSLTRSCFCNRFSSETNALVRVFITLQLTGCFAFAFMVFSAILFASTVKRHPIWFNFCLSFIVFSLSYSLLAFAPGRQQRNEAPSEGVCIAQAVMVYAAPFLYASPSEELMDEEYIDMDLEQRQRH